MSRVHDALRRAEESARSSEEIISAAAPLPPTVEETAAPAPLGGRAVAVPPVRLNIHPGMLGEVALVPFQPAPETHLLDLNNSHETPAEEFRTLRTRLNHLQTLRMYEEWATLADLREGRLQGAAVLIP